MQKLIVCSKIMCDKKTWIKSLGRTTTVQERWYDLAH